MSTITFNVSLWLWSRLAGSGEGNAQEIRRVSVQTQKREICHIIISAYKCNHACILFLFISYISFISFISFYPLVFGSPPSAISCSPQLTADFPRTVS